MKPHRQQKRGREPEPDVIDFNTGEDRRLFLFLECYLLNSSMHVHDILFFRRYLDDLLIIFAHADNVDKFVLWLNMRDDNIQFTANYDPNMIPFLDVYIFRSENNKLAVRPYRKSTDKNTYLHFTSFHPLHLRSNLPFGQFLRYKRNSTIQADFDKETQNLYAQLELRGYPRRVLNTALNRAREVPRSSLLVPKQRSWDNRISWAIDYTPHSNQIRKVILKHWHVLKDIPGCETAPQIGFRRTRSLRNTLTRSDISKAPIIQDSGLPKGHFKCGRCKICHTVMDVKDLRVHGKTFKLR